MNSLMTHPDPRQKIALQSIALITLGAVFIPVWNVLKKTHISDVQASSVARVSDPLPSLLGDLYFILSISFLAILLGVTVPFTWKNGFLKQIGCGVSSRAKWGS